MTSITKRFNRTLVMIVVGVAIVAFVVFCNLNDAASLWFWNHLTDKSGALAAWIAALATVALVYGLFQTGQSLKESAQTTTFQRIYDQFGAPNMLHARAVLAKTHWERVEKGGIDRIRDNNLARQGWQVVNFLNNVGHLVKIDRLSFEDVLFAYGQHVQLICARWKSQLAHGCYQDRYKPLLDLCLRVNKSPQRTVHNQIELEWEQAQEAFWKSEAALDPNATSEDEVDVARNAGRPE